MCKRIFRAGGVARTSCCLSPDYVPTGLVPGTGSVLQDWIVRSSQGLGLVFEQQVQAEGG